ncbi:NADPH:quinone oxidoreductase family protein [Brevibacillus humidisoli]|uniref:quinone oxidoreductase family protein n=1 Tax=Brevibacillus humidisoli TaxID=2895522 RepID=UPI001E4B77C1|nr:NADPH:quinone oxidoreductase family protein [Brevibacillus humidisoli]UFJ43287.1 NADPH:quinone oxidoreductase family protein [Brevibacillus humidisoli]
MKAIQFREYGDPDVLQVVEVPTPVVKAGEVLIQVKAAGVNFADTMRRRNQYLTKTPLPYIPGSEIAGVVVEVSSGVTRYKVGDRVTALINEGGYAEYVSLSEHKVLPLPENVQDDQAAALLLQGLTAYHLLRTSGRMSQGESVLVHAAAGGVGTLAVQLAKQMGAGQVIAAASSSEKLELACALGADAGVNYSHADWNDKVMELTEGSGVDIVLEMVGGDHVNKSLSCLATFGRLVIYGRAGGEKTQLDPSVLMHRNTSVIGFWLPHMNQDPVLYRESVKELLQYVGEGTVKLIIGERMPLAEAKRAHELLEGRQTTGKIVLIP